MNIDPVEIEVIRNGLVASADEMFNMVMRTAYGSIIYEVKDFGVIYTDEVGRVYAQSAGHWGFMGSLPFGIKSCLKEVGDFEEGDAIINNNPYTNGTHLPDAGIYLPVFYKGEHVAFTACMAHLSDVGGTAPGGWNTDSTEVVQEGLMLCNMKLFEKGKPNETIFKIIRNNVRTPDIVEGDLKAMIASCNIGNNRFVEICDKHGLENVRSGMNDVFERTDRHVRNELRKIPDGSYQSKIEISDDGVELGKPVKVQLKLTIKDDKMIVDTTGSSQATKGPVNCPYASSVASARGIFKSIFNPNEHANDGDFRAMDFIAPPGSSLHPQYPSPCDSYGHLLNCVMIVTANALGQVIPERLIAHWPISTAILLYGPDPKKKDRQFFFGELIHFGMGARYTGDGESATAYIGLENTPVEVIETLYPLKVGQYTYHVDSGGAGKFRGGVGLVKDFIATADEVFMTSILEVTPIWGIDGGKEGQRSFFEVQLGPEDKPEKFLKKVSLYGPYKKGGMVRVVTGGGGGRGSPLERDPKQVLEDVIRGFVSIKKAQEEYGVVINSEASTVEQEATARLRDSKR